MNLHTSGLRGAAGWSGRGCEREGHSAATGTGSQIDVGARTDLWSALSTLPARQRAALVLRYYEDLSERDTAEALGCTRRRGQVARRPRLRRDARPTAHLRL